MSRAKKSRRLKGKLDIKTGSKKNFIERGQKGRIPSKNKLAKHGDKQQSAYKKYLEEQQKSNSESSKTVDEEELVTAQAPAPFSRASKAAVTDSTSATAIEKKAKPKTKADTASAERPAAKPKKTAVPKPKATDEGTPAGSSTPSKDDKPKSKASKTAPDFDTLTGDDLWNLLDD